MNHALRTLLTRLVDYAGLFPPATLAMPDAVSNYARYRGDEHRWMLARFITPVARLGELEAAAQHHTAARDEWALSVLPGADIAADLDAIADFNRRNAGRLRIDTIEAKAGRAEEIRALDAAVPDELALFVEIPVDDDPAPLVEAIAAAGRFAKIRTGGVTPDSFAAPDVIVRFVRRCHESGVAFKATAGLHHPLRCVRPLSYESGAPRGTMNGFVNLFLAAALMREGLPDDELVALLLTDDRRAFSLEDDAIAWRGHAAAAAAIAATRRELTISFGSCSFEEPVDELKEFAWLD